MNRAFLASACVVSTALLACGTGQVLDLGGDAGSDAARGPDGDIDAAFVPGNPFPCGSDGCRPPGVCCISEGLGEACVAESLCHNVAQGCLFPTCPNGSLCCALLFENDAGAPLGWTRCVQGSACPDGTQTLCELIPFGPEGAGLGCQPDEVCWGGFCRPAPADGGTD